jgi:hypothetical protein
MSARHHLRILLAACACRPVAKDEPVFDRTFAPLDVVKRCKSRTDHGSTTENPEIDAVSVTLTGGVYHLNPPTIGCDLEAEIDETRLLFRPQSCATGAREQSEIQGAAHFDIEGILELHLTSVELWAPSPDFWPDGLWWDCSHDYLLEPLE